MWLMSRVGPAVLAAGVWLALTGVLLADALEVPPLSGRIVDLAGVLPPAVAEELSAKLQAHEAKDHQSGGGADCPVAGGRAAV